LPDRYLGAEAGFDATYHVVLGDIGHTWEVRATTHGARVRKGVTRRQPDVTIGTDSVTWLRLRRGDFSGIEAFSQRRLYARGSLDLAVGFEGLFRLPNGRQPLLRMHDVRLGRTRVSTLTMGEGHDLLLLHGLGSNKASFLDTAAALSRSYRVHALDLPGFGSSSKSATAPYDARYFAQTVIGVMEQLGIERAHIVGNSLGGRVAIEAALRHPERVTALALLCPAVAFVRRGYYHPIVRVLRPEFALLPHRFPGRTVANRFWGMFADPDLVDPIVADIVVDEFQRVYGSPGARLAFLAAARNSVATASIPASPSWSLLPCSCGPPTTS
jgi:pimeloyl-ACP methyl ester carboxylesterase